jgi:hypothetical protein
MCCTHLFGDGNFISHNTIKIIKQGSIPINGGEETTKAHKKANPCIFNFSHKSQYPINYNCILDFLIIKEPSIIPTKDLSMSKLGKN